MNYQDFEKKINKIYEDLTNYIMQNQISEDKFIQNILEQNKDNLNIKLELLKSIENKIVQDQNNHETFLKKTKEFLEEKCKELEKDVLSYQNTHTADQKKVELLLKKDEELHEFRIATKRERSELTTKLNNLEREYHTKSKEIDEILLDEEKKHKTKLADLSKKLSFDLQKHVDDVIKECSEFEKQLLKTNQKSEITKIKKEILAIRKYGFETETKMKETYYLDLKSELFTYSKNYETQKLSQDIIKHDYALRIENIKHQIKMLDYKEENANKLHDFKDEERLIDFLKNNDEKTLAMKHDYVNLFQTENEKVLESLSNLYKIKTSDYASLFEEFSKSDLSQVDIFEPVYSYNYEQKILKMKEISSSLTQIVNSYKDYTMFLLGELLEEQTNINQKMYETFLMFYLENIVEFSFQESILALKTLNEEFHKQQRARLENFKKNMNVSFRLIVKQIEIMLDGLLEYQKAEHQEAKTFLYNVKEILRNRNDEIKKYNQEIAEECKRNHYAKRMPYIQTDIENKGKLTVEFKTAEENYQAELKALRVRQNEYLGLFLVNNYKNRMKDIKNELAMSKKKYKETILKLENDLRLQHKANIRLINHEHRDKLKLL